MHQRAKRAAPRGVAARAAFAAAAALALSTALPQALAAPRTLSQPSHAVPEGAPHVVVHGPASPAGGRVVIFLHGWRGCAAVLAGTGPQSCRQSEPAQEGWGLAAAHDSAGLGSTFLVPQLAYRRRTGNPGRFGEPGFFDAWLHEALPDLAAPASVALVAHSAGFETAAAILDDPERHTPIRHVVLLDALYAREGSFAQWLEGDAQRRLVSLHGGHGTTGRVNARLVRLLRHAKVSVMRGKGVPTTERLRDARAAVHEMRTPHARYPQEHLADVLRALPW